MVNPFDIKKMKKKLVTASLETLILEMCQEKPTHGYAMIDQIKKRFGVYLAPSVMYPTARGMEKRGLLHSEWELLSSERPRKVYSLTSSGKSACISVQVVFKELANEIVR